MTDLSKFFELTLNPMCVLNADMQCLKINGAFEKILGDSSAAVEGKQFSDLSYSEDRGTTQARLDHFWQNRASTGNTVTRMTSRYGRAGAIVWVEWRLVAVLPEQTIYCTGRNVTARIKQLVKSQGRYLNLLQAKEAGLLMSAAAQQEVELYAQAIRNIPIGFFILQMDDVDDPNSLRLIVSNPAASACTGVPIENALGTPLIHIFPNLKDTDVLERYATVVRSAQPINLGEVTYEDGRVERSTFFVRAFPLKENYLGVVFEDITLRKQKEDDLLTVNKLLTETMSVLEHRNQELDQFAYVASHDLKAPLRAIASLAAWIEEDLGSTLPAENKEQFELLKSRVGRMEGLINGLLAYSRIGRVAQQCEQVDVGTLLSEIAESLLPNRANRGMTTGGMTTGGISADSVTADSVTADDVTTGGMTIDIAPNMPVLCTQKIPLVQIFQNLISNAIKHHDRPDGQIKISVNALKDVYEFVISDDGPGIEEIYHDKIFAIFQTLKARDDHESTGIGLSIVRKILIEVGGSIAVESNPGEGTTFRFTWPKEG